MGAHCRHISLLLTIQNGHFAINDCELFHIIMLCKSFDRIIRNLVLRRYGGTTDGRNY